MSVLTPNTPWRLLIEAKTNGTPLQRTKYPQANTPTTPVDVISYGGIDKVCWLLLIEGYLRSTEVEYLMVGAD